MIESLCNCPAPNYSRIAHSPKRSTSSVIDIVFRLKEELAKIKTRVKDMKVQVFVIHLSLTSEIAYTGKYGLGY